MLRDLEELVLLVRDDDVRKQMHEAVRCYHAGAYRAAVVMSVAAGMHDLRRRVDELVNTGAGSLRKLRDDINSKEAEEAAWEQMLLDGCKRDDLISSSDFQKLTLLLRTRHLCAHPTGHSGSAEEARDTISALIDRILSRPTQAGGLEVKTLVAERLPFPHYLAGDPVQVVSDELSKLQPRVFGHLAREIAQKIDSAQEPQLSKNAAIFLAEMAKTHTGPLSQAATVAVTEIARILTTGTAATLLPIFAHAPEIFALLDSIARGRLVDVLCRNVVPNLTTIDVLARSGALSDVEHGQLLASATEVGCSTEHANRFLTTTRWPDLRTGVSEWLTERMTSSQYVIANPAIDIFESLLRGQAIDDWPMEMRLRAVYGLAHSARYGAWSSERMQGSGLPEDFLLPVLNRILELPEHRFDNWDTDELVKFAKSSLKSETVTDHLGQLLDGSMDLSTAQRDYREHFILRAMKEFPIEVADAVNSTTSDFDWLVENEQLHNKLLEQRTQQSAEDPAAS